jgi:hypothetical protein
LHLLRGEFLFSAQISTPKGLAELKLCQQQSGKVSPILFHGFTAVADLFV